MNIREYGVHKEFINVHKSLYEGVEASVLLGGEGAYSARYLSGSMSKLEQTSWL